MALAFEHPLVELTSLLVLVGALVVAAVLITRYSGHDLLSPVRERFVLGVPWGTVTVIAGLYLIYYLVQGAGGEGGPIVEGFRSWSLWYPQGTIFSSFTHAGDGHIRGNVYGTIAFAPIAEYAWRHYPEDGARITTPVARIGAFVGAIVLVGLAGSLFVPGAIIGFSGVVFALAGFALVVRPLLAVGAMLAIQVVRLVVDALFDPVVIAASQPQFVSPSWANTALQGHLFGVLVGVLLAVALFGLRGESPDIRYVFFAALVFAVTRSLWAVYWFLGADEFVLFQAAGVAGVVVFATLVAFATRPAGTRLRSRIGPAIPVRAIAIILLGGVIVVLATSGLVYSIVTVSPGEDLDGGVEVNDYTVAYVDDVEDQYIGAVEIPGIGSPLSTNVSGVVVASDQRNAWGLAISSSQLAFDGEATVPVGDATWRESVHIDRTEWSFVDGNSTYRVVADHDGGHLLHTDSPAEGNATLDDTVVSIEATDAGYDLLTRQTGSDTTDRMSMLESNETADLGGLTFERVENDLFVSYDETELRLAEFNRSNR